jgi:asparagine synthase (glutamine-hydrolysing)
MRADKMAMANAVEIRVPFLDQHLMDFSMRVPDTYKLRDGISKEPVKRLALQFASRDEIFRPKTGFGVPVQHWFKGELGASLLERLDSDKSGIVKSLLDVDALKHHLRHGLRTVNEGFQLWVIYNLLVWREGLAS